MRSGGPTVGPGGARARARGGSGLGPGGARAVCQGGQGWGQGGHGPPGPPAGIDGPAPVNCCYQLFIQLVRTT